MKIGAIVICLGLAGCFSTGVKVDQSKLSSLRTGETTYDQAVALLGKPTNTVMRSDGSRMATYMYIHAQPNAVNFVPVVGAFAGGATSESTTLMVNFGPDGKMTTYTSSQGSNQVGTGLMSGQAQ